MTAVSDEAQTAAGSATVEDPAGAVGEGAAAPAGDQPDLSVILPVEGTFTIPIKGEDVPVTVRRLKTREFLLLMRVLTTGLGQGITQIRLDMDDPDEMQAQMLSIFMLAVPEALEEFGEFLMAIVDPKKGDDAARVRAYMMNPDDPGVLLDVLGVLIEQEKDDLVVLGGKAQAWLARLAKTFSQQSGPTG